MTLKASQEDFDWLGPGVYFWESDPKRALEWAQAKVAKGRFTEPFVVGAIIDLGNCLDLLVRENHEVLRDAYDSLVQINTKSGFTLAQNRDISSKGPPDKLLRELDCAVIRHLHGMIGSQDKRRKDRVEAFDTVRGLFTEGEAVYPGGGFFEKTHTQISVRNDKSIRGYFVPR